MPPPGSGKKTGLMVAIGIGKPKAPMPKGGPDSGMDGQQAASQGKKATPEEAHVVREDRHCKSCRNYQPESGECSKVQTTFAPEDACLVYFEPMSGADDEDEPDEDDMGGSPDGDEDDYSG
jgi:hypothetical protein